jgi:cold shock CspA family protein
LLGRLSRHCRGWDAYKGGKLAGRLEQRELAVELLERASRDRMTRNEPRVHEALAAARASAPLRARSENASTEPGDVERGEGEVAVVRADRGFGFLVDDSGTRRHFRLRGQHQLNVGDRVSFVAVSADKGPAARELQPL